jgi:hypothetical protein
MDNPNTLSILGKLDTERRQTNKWKIKTKHNKQTNKNSKRNTIQKTQSYSIWCETTKDWKIQKNKKQEQKLKTKTKTKQEQKTNKTKTSWCNTMFSERNKHLLVFDWQLMLFSDVKVAMRS